MREDQLRGIISFDDGFEKLSSCGQAAWPDPEEGFSGKNGGVETGRLVRAQTNGMHTLCCPPSAWTTSTK